MFIWQTAEKVLISARINPPPGDDAHSSRKEER